MGIHTRIVCWFSAHCQTGLPTVDLDSRSAVELETRSFEIVSNAVCGKR